MKGRTKKSEGIVSKQPLESREETETENSEEEKATRWRTRPTRNQVTSVARPWGPLQTPGLSMDDDQSHVVAVIVAVTAVASAVALEHYPRIIDVDSFVDFRAASSGSEAPEQEW